MTPVNFSPCKYISRHIRIRTRTRTRTVIRIGMMILFCGDILAFRHQPLAMAQGWWVGILSPVRLSANRPGTLDQRFYFSGIFIRLVDNPHVAS